MICVEIPLRTLRDQAASLENAATSEAGLQFAAGALSALRWLADREAVAPIHELLALEHRPLQ